MLRPALFCLAITGLHVALPAHAKTVDVSDAAGLVAAIAGAAAGDEIVLADGTYTVQQSPKCTAAGTASAPISDRRDGMRWRAR